MSSRGGVATKSRGNGDAFQRELPLGFAPTVTMEAEVRRSADALAALAGEPDIGFVKVIGLVEASLFQLHSSYDLFNDAMSAMFTEFRGSRRRALPHWWRSWRCMTPSTPRRIRGTGNCSKTTSTTPSTFRRRSGWRRKTSYPRSAGPIPAQGDGGAVQPDRRRGLPEVARGKGDHHEPKICSQAQALSRRMTSFGRRLTSLRRRISQRSVPARRRIKPSARMCLSLDQAPTSAPSTSVSTMLSLRMMMARSPTRPLLLWLWWTMATTTCRDPVVHGPSR